MTDPVIVKERAGGKYTQDVNTPRHHFFADEPASYGSADIGPAPYELLCASLGACTSITLRMYVERKKWDVENIAVRVTHKKIQLSDLPPKDVFTREITITGIFTVLVLLFNFALQRLGNSTLAFLVSLPFPFLVLHMTYCVYGKRLHDMGRSFWPLTGMITLLIVVAMVVMLSFGGSEYFSEFAQYDRKEDINPAEIERIKSAYQARLSEGNATVHNVMAGIIVHQADGLTRQNSPRPQLY